MDHRSWWTRARRPLPPPLVKQTHEEGCGPACGEMLLLDRGFMVDQRVIARGLPLPISAEELAARLCEVSPLRWVGAFINLAEGPSSGAVAGISVEHGSWAALLEPGGYRAIGHWVVVDGVSQEGMVWIRDPRGEAYGTPMVEFLGLWRYSMMVIEVLP